ncbi:MAG: hypothetical protein K2Y27_27520 [Xanthobacteraceae bacterium]|nr:hypothetical protein [Xanthobacteraceae bacterium]
MMARAIICCAALILGLLATIGATAQSANVCNGPGCRATEKSRPLDLMAFMRGGAKAGGQSTAKATTAKSGKTKHRRGGSRPAPRPVPESAPDITPDPTRDVATSPQPAGLPSAVAAAYAAHAETDVQVVMSDELNPIDLAMAGGSPETVGATPKTDSDASERITSAEARQIDDQIRNAASGPSDAGTSPGKETSHSDAALRDESWMGRIWSAVGDGFIALVAMVRQLFA